LQSYQNLKILQNLYRLQAIGYTYMDSIDLNKSTHEHIATDIFNLEKQIYSCHLCDLSKSRKQSMSGFGSKNASLMLIDYTVSEIEDTSNSYFCGRSGELLTNMIQNVLDINIEETYYTHLLKCKPSNSKKQLDAEWRSCQSYLFSQIQYIDPKLIVTLGKDAYEKLTGQTGMFEDVRGHIIEFNDSQLIPIYHPNFILRNPNLKKIVYNDLKTIKSCL